MSEFTIINYDFFDIVHTEREREREANSHTHFKISFVFNNPSQCDIVYHKKVREPS